MKNFFQRFLFPVLTTVSLVMSAFVPEAKAGMSVRVVDPKAPEPAQTESAAPQIKLPPVIKEVTKRRAPASTIVLPAPEKKAAIAPIAHVKQEAPKETSPAPRADDTTPLKTTVKLKRGDTVYGMLRANGVSRRDRYRATIALEDLLGGQSRNLKAGQEFELEKSADGRVLLGLSYIDGDTQLSLTLDKGGKYSGQKALASGKPSTAVYMGQVDANLYDSARHEGASRAVMQKIQEIYGEKADFSRLPKGTAFQIQTEKVELANGKIIEHVLYASLEINGTPLEVVRHVMPNGVEVYLDIHNKTLKAPYQVPTKGKLGQGFGVHRANGEIHKGMDILNKEGTPINAVKAGRVAFAGVQNGFGNVIVIDHGNGETTAYAHLSTISVKADQSVKQGEVVAGMGHSGDTRGADGGPCTHLHFEKRVNGVAVNPAHDFFASVAPKSEWAKIDERRQAARTQIAAVQDQKYADDIETVARRKIEAENYRPLAKIESKDFSGIFEDIYGPTPKVLAQQDGFVRNLFKRAGQAMAGLSIISPAFAHEPVQQKPSKPDYSNVAADFETAYKRFLANLERPRLAVSHHAAPGPGGRR